jgi:hypothetical protein
MSTNRRPKKYVGLLIEGSELQTHALTWMSLTNILSEKKIPY